MSDRFLPPYSLGQTWTTGPASLVGQEHEHLDLDYSGTATYALEPLTGSTITAVAVLNDSGSTITPGKAVLWKDSYFRKRIGGLCTALGVVDGFVDPYVSSVPDQSYCWVIVKGPVKVVSDGAAAISERGSVVTGSSGKVTKLPTTAADAITAQNQANAVCGKAMEACTNVDGTLFRIYANCK